MDATPSLRMPAQDPFWSSSSAGTATRRRRPEGIRWRGRDPRRRSFARRAPGREDRDGHRSRDAADGRVDRRGHDHQVAREGRRPRRARPAAVRDLDRQGGRRDPEPGRRRAARDPARRGRDGAGPAVVALLGEPARRRRAAQRGRRPGPAAAGPPRPGARAGAGARGAAAVALRRLPPRRPRSGARRHRRLARGACAHGLLAARPQHRARGGRRHLAGVRDRDSRARDQGRHPRLPRAAQERRVAGAVGSAGSAASGRRPGWTPASTFPPTSPARTS